MLAILLLSRMNAKRRISRARDASSNKNLALEEAGSIYCRTCLCKDDLVDIFHSKDTIEKRTRELKLITGLEITINDGLSQKICMNCVQIINKALQFRKSCRKTEKALLRMLDTKQVKGSRETKYSIEEPLETKYEEQPETKYEGSWPDNMKYEDDGFDYGGDGYTDDYLDLKDVLGNIKKRESLYKTARPPKRTKKGATAFKCTTCNKEFKMKATYKAHMRFHTNFCVCESCGKRCRNNNQLQEHKRAKHGLGRIHKCAYCEYSSATKEALTIHERRHTGERPYTCDHCGATFHRRANLVQHIAIHLPDKNFQCDMCPKRLKSKKFLQIHKHNAHTGRRYGYICGICEHVFEKPNKVRAHMRRVHAVPDEQQPPVHRIQL